MNEIIYRRATIVDIQVLIDYRILFLKEIKQEYDPEKEEILRKGLTKYFQTNLQQNSYVAWLAEKDGKPVGFGGMVLRTQPGNFHVPQGKTGYILNMYTLPKWRGLGIGKRILEKLIETGKKLKLDRIDLDATKMGEVLYRKYGFKDTHYKALELMLN
jgi:ribosomal protein S18 acetylase RimI-like enzyme